MNIFLDILLLIIGLVLLIKGSDIFVDSGTVIGKLFKMSEILIGLTIVCIGTSLPELILSIRGAVYNNSELIIGDIVGSNIFNMCCILGFVCLIKPLRLLKETIRKDINMSLISSIALLFLVLDANGEHILTRNDGVILLLFFAIFLYYTFYEITGQLREKREKKYIDKKNKKEKVKENIVKFTKEDIKKLGINLFLAILGIVMVHVGAKLTINSVVNVANYFNVSQTFISIIVVAIGTSLPELSTSLAAVRKNRINVAIGNLIGSNMFNVLFVLGVSSVIAPIKLAGSFMLVDCIVFIIVCLTLRFITRKKPEISKMEALSLLIIYFVYLIYVIYRH